MNRYLVLLTCFLCGCATLPKEVTLVQPLPQHQYVHVAPLVKQPGYMRRDDVDTEVAELYKRFELFKIQSSDTSDDIQHDLYRATYQIEAIIRSIKPYATSEETLLQKVRLIRDYEQFLMNYHSLESKKVKDLETLDQRARDLCVYY